VDGRFIGSDTRKPFSSKKIFSIWLGDSVIAFM